MSRVLPDPLAVASHTAGVPREALARAGFKQVKSQLTLTILGVIGVISF